MITNAHIFLSFLILVALCDCTCSKPIIIKSVLLETPSENYAHSSIDSEKFSQVIERAFSKNRSFRYEPKNEKGYLLRFGFTQVERALGNNSVVFYAVLLDAAGDQLYKAFSDIEMVDKSISGKQIFESVLKLLSNLASISSGGKPHNQHYMSKLEAYLSGDKIERDELVTAISVLGETNDKQASLLIIKMLSNTTDIVLGNACVMALAQMADPNAMAAIIDFAEGKPPLIRRQAIMAARRIATKQAAEWLLVMAYGYDDPLVKKEALEALSEVEEKLKKQSP